MKFSAPFLLFILFSSPLFAQENDYDVKFLSTAAAAVKVGFPIYGNLQGQVDLQYATQSNYSKSDPFAYAKNLDRRAWLIYKGFKNTKLAVGYSYKDKYAIPDLVAKQSDEHRISAYATFTQLHGNINVFEQVRAEVRVFDDSKNIRRVVPRLRTRFGTTYLLHQHSSKTLLQNTSLSWYGDLAFRFPSSNYSTKHFDTFKQSVYYSAGINSHLSFDAICNAQVQLKPNGKQFIFSYGPQLIAKYNL